MIAALRIREEAARRLHVDPARLRAAVGLLAESVAARQIPGLVASFGRYDECLMEMAAGFAVDLPELRVPMTTATLFDLASLTKVCATLPAALSLVEEGRLLLTDPVARYIPAFAEGSKNAVTVAHLLTHTSGLPADDPLWKWPDLDSRWRRVETIALATSPGTRVVYSDIGFMLLGRIVERVAGEGLCEYAERAVFAPWRMKTARYVKIPDTKREGIDVHGLVPAPEKPDGPPFAATEPLPGGRVVYGAVHDEKAYAVGGVAGHAGLFGTAADVAAVAAAWSTGGAGVLSRRTVALAASLHTEGLGGRRGLGWCLRGDRLDHMGDLWPGQAIGHTGFTGTSLAVCPSSGYWFVLLTNRVHYGRRTDISRLRKAVHNAVAASMLAP